MIFYRIVNQFIRNQLKLQVSLTIQTENIIQIGPNWYNYADLNFGREKFISKPEDYQEHLDGLIETLKNLPKTEKCADFVTWRGIITRILCTPFKPKDSWGFNVMRRGVRLKWSRLILKI